MNRDDFRRGYGIRHAIQDLLDGCREPERARVIGYIGYLRHENREALRDEHLARDRATAQAAAASARAESFEKLSRDLFASVVLGPPKEVA